MKKKVAVLFTSNIYDQKGLFLAVHNRCLYLKKIADFEVDVFVFVTYKGKLLSKILNISSVEKINVFEKDGLKYNVIWRENSVMDYILYHKLRRPEIFHKLFNEKIVSRFSGYDLLDIHSGCCDIALICKQKYGIPYIVTWHGSDIHTVPYYSIYNMKCVVKYLKNASANCFVSNALYEQSKKLLSVENYEILYNGVSPKFTRYIDSRIEKIANQYNVINKKIVAFIGNIIDIKNPLLLPDIFDLVNKKCESTIEFWVIGDGELKQNLEKKLAQTACTYRLWGNVNPDTMPELLQCIDVVVLPSKNEGLSMTLLEAIACGANAVSSNVGGCKEVVGEKNAINLDDNFIENISNRIIYLLQNEVRQVLKQEFSWELTAIKENRIITEIFGK